MKNINATKIVGEQDRLLLAELKDVIRHHLPNAKVALYGSAARGKALPDSDYDILVLTPNKPTSSEERELDRAIYNLQLDKEVVLSVTIYTQEQWCNPVFRSSPYRKNVIREGIIL